MLFWAVSRAFYVKGAMHVYWMEGSIGSGTCMFIGWSEALCQSDSLPANVLKSKYNVTLAPQLCLMNYEIYLEFFLISIEENSYWSPKLSSHDGVYVFLCLLLCTVAHLFMARLSLWLVGVAGGFLPMDALVSSRSKKHKDKGRATLLNNFSS